MNTIPSSIEAEESLIGAMLQNPSAIAIAQSKVRPSDFYSERNRLMYESILSMADRSIGINAETALRYLKENNLFDTISQNDEAYLLRIIDGTTFPQNAKYYAEIISEKSILRDLIYATQNIQKIAYDAGEEDAKEIADQAEKLVFEVTQRRLDNDFSTIKDLIIEVIKTIEIRAKNAKSNDSITGVPSGFRELDKITHGFQPSDLIILAARPSVGKTSFALNVIENIMSNTQSMNFGIGLFSLEMSKMQIVERMLASKARISLSDVRSGNINKGDWPILGKTFEQLSKPNLLIDDSSQLTIMELRGKARQMKYKFAELRKTSKSESDLNIIIVDYLQLLHASAGTRRGGTREQEVAEISRGLKALAKELNVPVIALAQLSRAIENRQGEKPRLSDLRESGSIEQDADIVMFLHRPTKSNKDDLPIEDDKSDIEIVISKHRNGSISDGIPLTFISSQTRFTNKNNDNYRAS